VGLAQLSLDGFRMDPIMTGLSSFGMGGLAVAALIWFLVQLVTKTMPANQEALMTMFRLDREQRGEEAKERLRALQELSQSVRDANEALLDRIDVSFREIVAELSQLRMHIQARNGKAPGPGGSSPPP